MISNENRRVTAVISKDIYKKLEKEAEYEDRTISKMVAKIIKEHYNVKDDD